MNVNVVPKMTTFQINASKVLTENNLLNIICPIAEIELGSFELKGTNVSLGRVSAST